MTARGTLISIARYFTDRNPDYPETPEGMVDAFAHELAEQQRQNCDNVTCGPQGACCACKEQAALIDPTSAST